MSLESGIRSFTKESKALLRGEYGQLPAQVNEEVRKKAIGDDKVVTCRPADLIENEMDKLREETKDFAKSEEDVLSYALFPQVAKKFFDFRDHRSEAIPSQDTANMASPDAIRTIYVQDLSV